MTTTFTVTLGGVAYETPKFNLRQIRQIARLSQSDMPPADLPFEVLRMALERATPPVTTEDDLMDIQPLDGEWTVAIQTVMTKAGLRRDAVAGEAKGPETPPA